MGNVDMEGGRWEKGGWGMGTSKRIICKNREIHFLYLSIFYSRGALNVKCETSQKNDSSKMQLFLLLPGWELASFLSGKMTSSWRRWINAPPGMFDVLDFNDASPVLRVTEQPHWAASPVQPPELTGDACKQNNCRLPNATSWIGKVAYLELRVLTIMCVTCVRQGEYLMVRYERYRMRCASRTSMSTWCGENTLTILKDRIQHLWMINNQAKEICSDIKL